jgi:hypothetical protein
MLRQLQMEAESAWPTAEQPQPQPQLPSSQTSNLPTALTTSQPIPVLAPQTKPLTEESVDLTRIAVALERIAVCLENSHVSIKKKRIKRISTK